MRPGMQLSGPWALVPETLLGLNREQGGVVLSAPHSLPGYYCDSRAGPVQDFSLYPCPQGYYCPLGTFIATQHSCPAGTYGPRKGLRSLTECQLCPAGKFCALAGLTAPTGMSYRAEKALGSGWARVAGPRPGGGGDASGESPGTWTTDQHGARAAWACWARRRSSFPLPSQNPLGQKHIAPHPASGCQEGCAWA